ncbi:MAG: hypothetical protein U0744_04275 [Gemmataceae bacterium]
MRLRWTVLFVLGFVSDAAAQTPLRAGHLLRHQRDAEGIVRQSSENYVPREGDMVFFNDHSVKWGLLYKMVGSDAPYHSALVFRRPDGMPALVEAGPNDTLVCRVMEIAPRLHAFEGTIHVRRCKKTLSVEESEALTKFALAQDGKRYALGRMLLQGTPFRARGPVRRWMWGATLTDRDAYICSELVVAGAAIAGILDPEQHKANAMYPRDLIYDDGYDLSERYEQAQVWLRDPLSHSIDFAKRPMPSAPPGPIASPLMQVQYQQIAPPPRMAPPMPYGFRPYE